MSELLDPRVPAESECRQAFVKAKCPGCGDTVRRQVYVYRTNPEWWRCTACQFEMSAAVHARLGARAAAKARAIRAQRLAK